MAAKLRVRDLAIELKVGNKDILNTLRRLGIQVRSHMSGLTEEEADQVRGEMTKTTQPRSEVIRREVQPGVIVRRRKKARGGSRGAESDQVQEETEDAQEEQVEEFLEPQQQEESAPEHPEEESKAEEETPDLATPPAEDEEKPMEQARIIKPVQEPEAKVVSAPVEQPVEEAPEPEIVKESATEQDEAPVEEKVEAVAEAESEPSEAEQDQAEPVAVEEPVEAEEKTEEEVQAKADDEPVQAKQAAKGEDSSADDDAAEAEPKKKKKRRKKKKEAQSGPQVRIISMPDPTPEPQPEQKTEPRGDRPSQDGDRRRPSRPPRRGGYSAPAAPANVPPPDPNAAGARKKRKKDRRVVDFSGGPSAGYDGGKKGRKKGDDPEAIAFKKGYRKKKKTAHEDKSSSTQPLKAAKRKIKIQDAVRVSDMAKQMGIKAQEIIKILFGLGIMATINQSLDFDTAVVVASEFGYEVENVAFAEEEFLLPKEADSEENLKGRPPVVTIMGHVDHGKTSLLDAIRKTNVTAGEAGGITQHIGAYFVKTSRGDIVFLDTPGHEAFTTMRARGAQVTDLVVLVVAADDGVMDQTREAINHSKAAGVPILVAVNKIDKEDANPDRAKRELAEFGLVPEDWGGDTIFTNVSAKANIGIDDLLELIALQAEVMELKANPDKPARGHIVEAKLDKGRGPVGTVLIQEGTLHQNDPFVCGIYSGRVRAMFNDKGRKIKVAGPSVPVEVQGFEGVPEAGDEFVCVNDDKVARRIADARQQKRRAKELAGKSKVTLETFLASRPDQEVRSLNLVVKADVQGSLEAIIEALSKQETDEVKVTVIHAAAGAITESDILLASASEAIIIGFNVRPTAKIKDVADEEHVEIRFYDVIYKLVQEVRDALSGMLAPDIKEFYLGQAEVRQTFSVPKVGTVAGCAVVDGKLTRDARIRLLRDGVVMYTGNLNSLKRFKDDAKEVLKGYECGVGLEKFNDIKVGDVIDAFEEKEVARTLDG